MSNQKGLRDGIVDPGAVHYEEKFEFPFWTLVKKRAEEKDISFSDAAALVAPEYAATLRIRDVEFTDSEIAKGEAAAINREMTGKLEEKDAYKIGQGR
jgi:hypothetical protein